MTNKAGNWDRFDLADGTHRKEEVGAPISEILPNFPPPVTSRPEGSGGTEGGD